MRAVPWTKPEDWTSDPAKPAKGLGGHQEGKFFTRFCDGSVHVLDATIPEDTLRKLLTYNDGKIVEIPH